MTEHLIASLILISPLAFVATALTSWFQPGIRPQLVKRFSTISTVIGLLTAVFYCTMVAKYSLLETGFLGIGNVGLSLRIDSISVIMFSMIALLSFIIIRFSLNYLDGDKRQGAFIGRLAATIASVQLLVLSGNLGILFISWVLTSITLHRLLIFYRERPGAIIAARKKFLIARLADLCVLSAAIILYQIFETANLEEIFSLIKNNFANDSSPYNLEIVALLFATAAILKSAQFPTHGWLIEVMETPTPVSALLHAGLLNAGPFLIIRMAFIMESTTYASIVLIVIGAFTSLFASVVYLTQTSVKTALGYSSVGHMGFSLMMCGFSLFPAAMLHLVAHSFYKAHSFLASGGVIESVQSSKVISAIRRGNPFRIVVGIVFACILYAGFAALWGIYPTTEFALFAVGAIIVMGLSRLFTTALDSNIPVMLILRASLLAVIVAAAFFTLESAAHQLLSAQIPPISSPSNFERVLIIAILILFAITVFIQILSPLLQTKRVYIVLAIHLRNGLYANAWLDRIVRSLYSHDKSGEKLINAADLNTNPHEKLIIREKQPI